jgi:hypothetical protein
VSLADRAKTLPRLCTFLQKAVGYSGIEAITGGRILAISIFFEGAIA